MTDHERALLLAVAKCATVSNHHPELFPLIVAVEYDTNIAAVEAEAAPETPTEKTCNNCRHNHEDGLTYSCQIEGPFGFDADDNCRDWQPKPTEGVCPTCHGDGDIDDGSLSGKQCPDCKKEKK